MCVCLRVCTRANVPVWVCRNVIRPASGSVWQRSCLSSQNDFSLSIPPHSVCISTFIFFLPMILLLWMHFYRIFFTAFVKEKETHCMLTMLHFESPDWWQMFNLYLNVHCMHWTIIHTFISTVYEMVSHTTAIVLLSFNYNASYC